MKYVRIKEIWDNTGVVEITDIQKNIIKDNSYVKEYYMPYDEYIQLERNKKLESLGI